MARLKSTALAEQAQLKAAHKADPNAHKEALAKGIEPGARVRFREVPQQGYEQLGGLEHYGVVRSVAKDHLVVEQNGAIYSKKGRLKEMFRGGKDIVVADYKIPFTNVKEVMGKGRLAERKPSATKSWPAPPERKGGYDNCDIGDCANPPVKAYAIRSFDRETTQLGAPRIAALCREHDEKWPTLTEEEKKGIPSKEPTVVPMLWRMGVTFESWRIPPKVSDEKEE